MPDRIGMFLLGSLLMLAALILADIYPAAALRVLTGIKGLW